MNTIIFTCVRSVAVAAAFALSACAVDIAPLPHLATANGVSSDTSNAEQPDTDTRSPQDADVARQSSSDTSLTVDARPGDEGLRWIDSDHTGTDCEDTCAEVTLSALNASMLIEGDSDFDLLGSQLISAEGSGDWNDELWMATGTELNATWWRADGRMLTSVVTDTWLGVVSEPVAGTGDLRLLPAIDSGADYDADGFNDTIIGTWDPSAGAVGACVLPGSELGYAASVPDDCLATVGGSLIADDPAVVVSLRQDLDRDGFADVLFGSPNEHGLAASAGSLTWIRGGQPGHHALSDLRRGDMHGWYGANDDELLGGTIQPLRGEDGWEQALFFDAQGTSYALLEPSEAPPYATLSPLCDGTAPHFAEYAGRSSTSVVFACGAQVRALNLSLGVNEPILSLGAIPRWLAAGDVDGDGSRDIVAGFPLAAQERGLVAVWLGPHGVVRPDIGAIPDIVIVGDEPGARLGFDGAVGDLDGDRIDDLAVGAPWFARDRDAGGAVYLFLSSDDAMRLSERTEL